jgi:hypothetical protein
MDPLAARVAARWIDSFKYEPKEKKEHRVERFAKAIREATGLSKGQSEAIADALVRGREVDRLALQKGWPVADLVVTGPAGTFDLRTLQ